MALLRPRRVLRGRSLRCPRKLRDGMHLADGVVGMVGMDGMDGMDGNILEYIEICWNILEYVENIWRIYD